MNNQISPSALKSLIYEIKEEEKAATEHNNKEMLLGLQIARVKIELFMESMGANRARTIDAEIPREIYPRSQDLSIEHKFYLNIGLNAFSLHTFIIQDLLDSTIGRMIEIGEELLKPDTCPHIELLTLADKPDNWQCEPVGIEFTKNAHAALRMFEKYEISIADVLDMTMETLTSIGSKLR